MEMQLAWVIYLSNDHVSISYRLRQTIYNSYTPKFPSRDLRSPTNVRRSNDQSVCRDRSSRTILKIDNSNTAIERLSPILRLKEILFPRARVSSREQVDQ